MSQRYIQGSSRSSMSSDTMVGSSSDSDGKSREKYDEDYLSSKKKPRVQSVESSIDTESDTPPTEAEKDFKPGRSLGNKVKKAWKTVKEKFSDKSNHTPKTKKSIPCEFKAYELSLSLDDRTALWKENGKNLFGNIKILAPDFKKSQAVIADLIVKGGEDFAADEFNAADYAGLGFDFFLTTMSHDALINPIRFFTSKSVITSTKTTADEFLANSDEEFLADSEDALPLSNGMLNKPIRLCASGIGPELFSNQLLDILREIPLTCPVILDVSSNNLGPDEVLKLVRLMEEHPVIYSLDLGNNPVCDDQKANSSLMQLQKANSSMMQLFDALGPVSRLFLNNTGFNDQNGFFIESSLASNCCLRHLSLQSNQLTHEGVIAIIEAVIPSDFADRAMTDSALTTVELQGNYHGSSDAIADALRFALRDVYGDDLGELPTLAPMFLGIDLSPSLLNKVKKFEPHFSQLTSPRGNSTDERL
jgi:hypothetical protein